MTRHLLTAYGLIFENQAPYGLPLPYSDAPKGADGADAIVRIGAVPKHLDHPELTRSLWQASPGRFLFKDEPVGRFLVTNGTEIVVAPAPGASAQDLTIYLQGSVTAALLMQRELVPFHASALVHDGGAVLFTGTSGAGKSTILAEFLRRGYCALADDISAVALDGMNQPRVFPAFPKTKLWDDTVAAFDHLDPAQALGRVRADLDKSVLPIQTFSHQPHPLKAVFVLGDQSKGMDGRRGLARVSLLGQCTYRRRMIKPLGAHVSQYNILTRIALDVPVFALPRSGDGFDVAAMADRVEDALAAPVNT